MRAIFDSDPLPTRLQSSCFPNRGPKVKDFGAVVSQFAQNKILSTVIQTPRTAVSAFLSIHFHRMTKIPYSKQIMNLRFAHFHNQCIFSAAPATKRPFSKMVENEGTRREKKGATPVALRTNNRQRGRHAGAISALLFGHGHVGSVSPSTTALPTTAEGVMRGTLLGVEVPLAEAVKCATDNDIREMLDDARATGRLPSLLGERNLRRQTPLHIAADAGKEGAVELLLDYGASANVVDGRGETALHAAGANGHTHIVRLLLRRGAQVLSDKQGQTALHRAAHRGHATAVAAMLDRGEAWFAWFADSFERGEAQGGSTPLHAATVAGHAAVVNVITKSFSHDPEKLEKLKTAANRWGVVPADISEGQAPPMLTACVRETLQKRKEAQSEVKRPADAEGVRWCENPAMIPRIPIGVQRKLEKEARERSQLQFETVQREMRSDTSDSYPHTASGYTHSRNGSQEDGAGGQAGWETPRTIRKTAFNFVLLPDGEVDLECVYQRCSPEGEGAGVQAQSREEANWGENTQSTYHRDVGEEGDEEEDLIDGDCEFEFNFDLMGMLDESEDESSSDDESQ